MEHFQMIESFNSSNCPISIIIRSTLHAQIPYNIKFKNLIFFGKHSVTKFWQQRDTADQNMIIYFGKLTIHEDYQMNLTAVH